MAPSAGAPPLAGVGQGGADAHAATANGVAGILLRRLSALSPLPGADAELVRGTAALPPRQHLARSELCAEGAPCPPRFVVSGWACRQRVLADGRRQIVSLLLPGDLLGPALRPRLTSSCAAVALTQVETVDAAALLDGTQGERDPLRPGIARALQLMDRTGERLLRDQVVRLGRQSAYERLLGLLLELRDRLLMVGLGEWTRFPLPLTQEVLADALGMSTVHVNRTLQQLRRDGLVTIGAGTVELLRPALAEGMADWQPLPGVVD